MDKKHAQKQFKMKLCEKREIKPDQDKTEWANRDSDSRKGAAMMRSFFTPKPNPSVLETSNLNKPAGLTVASRPAPISEQEDTVTRATSPISDEIFTGYVSDQSDDDILPLEENENDADDESDTAVGEATVRASYVDAPEENMSRLLFRVSDAPPPLKRRKLDVPVREARKKAREVREKALVKALDDINKLVRSKRGVFEAGKTGLQAYRARAIKSYLHMVVNNQRQGVDASERAAESQGFAAKWGGRMVRSWARKWVTDRELPVSLRGNHAKSFSVLTDPVVRAELRSYLRTNKWSMDPEKLSEFTKQKMLPALADKYLRNILDVEMPAGLKKYMELVLFPRIHLKAKKGVSLTTARRILRREGFEYTEHRKGLYYDGHERPDVVDYRQKEFLPKMAEHRHRLVEYTVGNVEVEVDKSLHNCVERRLVLCAHDEMTAQANDGKKKSWIFKGEQPLKKKGVGRGVHQSDVICSTVGWLEDASQTLEYGKNYEGYWTGELFVKQVR